MTRVAWSLVTLVIWERQGEAESERTKPSTTDFGENLGGDRGASGFAVHGPNEREQERGDYDLPAGGETARGKVKQNNVANNQGESLDWNQVNC